MECAFNLCRYRSGYLLEITYPGQANELELMFLIVF